MRERYKYFIGYRHDDYKIRLLLKMLSKTIAYVKNVKMFRSSTKWMFFYCIKLVIKKYNTIWDKLSPNIIKEFDRKLTFKKKI